MRTHRASNSFRLLIDSRSRNTNTTASNASFSLTKSICDVRSVSVKNVQFTNTLFNVRAGANTLTITGFPTATLEPSFYSPTQLVDAINAQITAAGSISYDATTNQVQFSLSSPIDIAESGLRDTLGLQVGQNQLPGFKTTLFLAAPLNVSFICPQLQSTYNVFTNRDRTTTQPFVTVPVTRGYLDMVYYAPSQLYTFGLGGASLSTLDFRDTDALTGDELSELGVWCMELEITTSTPR